jgi:hypothetical protein
MGISSRQAAGWRHGSTDRQARWPQEPARRPPRGPREAFQRTEIVAGARSEPLAGGPVRRRWMPPSGEEVGLRFGVMRPPAVRERTSRPGPPPARREASVAGQAARRSRGQAITSMPVWWRKRSHHGAGSVGGGRVLRAVPWGRAAVPWGRPVALGGARSGGSFSCQQSGFRPPIPALRARPRGRGCCA